MGGYPEKPSNPTNDYAVTTTCNKGTAVWDKTNWKLNITNYQPGMSCDVKFEPIFITIEYPPVYNITEDGVSRTTFPSKLAGYNYTVTTNCTNGTGSWDYTNWRMNITNNSNSQVVCNVNFVKTQIWCTSCAQYEGGVALEGTCEFYSGGGFRNNNGCWNGNCSGSWVGSVPNGSYYYYSAQNGVQYFGSNCENAKQNCRNAMYR